MMMNDNSFSDSESEDERITDDEILQYYPITSPNTSYPTLLEALKYDQDCHGFNLIDFLPSPDSDDFHEQTIVVINKCRSFIHQLGDGAELELNELYAFLRDPTKNDDDFFMPVLPDDAFLMYIDDLEDLKQAQLSLENVDVGVGAKIMGRHPEDDACSAAEGKNHIETVQDLNMKIQILEQQLNRATQFMTNVLDSQSDDEEVDTSRNRSKKQMPARDNDTYYFSSYSHSSIHETMLQDRVRTQAYQDAILNNRHMFEGKVVMDIGCGTGILSLFAAKAGAKKVIAIDASDMYKEATQIVAQNGYADVITVVHGKVEDLIGKNREKLPLQDGEQVDVVISEWMGYALFFETMLPSVMLVRDTLMDKTHGTMWPNRSVLFLEGAKDSRLDYWSNVYGFDMSVMKNRVNKELLNEASVEIVQDENIITNRDEIVVHDLNICQDKDLDFEVSFELKKKLEFQSNEETIDKLVISFDIYFDRKESSVTTFSTGCQTEPTHWKQTSLWFNSIDGVPTLKNNEVLRGLLSMQRNSTNPRDIDFVVQWEVGAYCADSFTGFEQRMKGTLVTGLKSI